MTALYVHVAIIIVHVCMGLHQLVDGVVRQLLQVHCPNYITCVVDYICIYMHIHVQT